MCVCANVMVELWENKIYTKIKIGANMVTCDMFDYFATRDRSQKIFIKDCMDGLGYGHDIDNASIVYRNMCFRPICNYPDKSIHQWICLEYTMRRPFED